MSAAPRRVRVEVLASGGIVLALLLAWVVPGVLAAPPPATPRSVPGITPATSGPDRWAFGGSLSSSFSCSTTKCPGGSASTNQTLSMNWDIGLNWVAIYTQTNISDTQTEYEAQTALGASISFGFSACVTTTTCQVETISLSVSGHQTLTGFTNVTSGSVDLLAGPGSPASVAALAIMNATSREAFNLSGSLSAQIPGASAETASGTYDVGGSESASIAFADPLSVVPVNPSPTDIWNASEPFTASGSYKSGLSLSATIDGTSRSFSEWTPGSVASSGTLNVSGTDVGAATLYDNYTTPHTTITGQEIILTFSGGNFTASDGWLLSSSAVLNGILADVGGITPAVVRGPAPAEVLAPTTARSLSSLDLLGNLTSSETAYYAPGHGFVGALLAENASNLTSGQPGGPKINLEAGPEPVSVADGQYSAITSGPGASGFPMYLLLGLAVVAVVVVVAVVLLVRARSARRRPPAPLTPAPSAAVVMPPPPQGGA